MQARVKGYLCWASSDGYASLQFNPQPGHITFKEFRLSAPPPLRLFLPTADWSMAVVNVDIENTCMHTCTLYTWHFLQLGTAAIRHTASCSSNNISINLQYVNRHKYVYVNRDAC